MAKRLQKKLYVAALIESHTSDLLIARPQRDEKAPRLWQFPRGVARRGESPEAALRRLARDVLGIKVEIIVAQPPLMERIDGVRTELRYFFCGVAGGEATPGPYAEIRWISKLHLREYDFDEPSQIVVDWLLAS